MSPVLRGLGEKMMYVLLLLFLTITLPFLVVGVLRLRLGIGTSFIFLVCMGFVVWVLHLHHGHVVPTLSHGHGILFSEIAWVHLVAVSHHRFVSHLLLRREINGVVPVEAATLEWESMRYHAWQELIVDHIPEHVGILFHKVLKHLQVGLTLRETAAVLDGHRLPDDELGQF